MSMDALYLAMSGAKQTMLSQIANSNNLANVSTTGFRADSFNAVSNDVGGTIPGSTVFTTNSKMTSDFSQGSIQATGRDLDIAIEGDGMIAVQSKTGEEVYTRAGNFRLNAHGQLETSSGLLVLGNGGPISIPPYETLHFSQDGSITIRPVGQDANALATVDRIKLTKPDTSQLVKGEDGLFHLSSGQAPIDPSVKIVPGSLESSNVNAVGAMVDMISLARQFEMQVDMIKEHQDSTDVLAQLLQI